MYVCECMCVRLSVCVSVHQQVKEGILQDIEFHAVLLYMVHKIYHLFTYCLQTRIA